MGDYTNMSGYYDLIMTSGYYDYEKIVDHILDDNGIWTCEQIYLPSILKTNSFDTICNTHLEYYSLRQIKYIADKTHFKIFKVSFSGSNFRVYLAKKESKFFNYCF